MQRRLLIVVLAVALLIPHSALTWNGRGHMTVAAIAYQQLNETIQAKVDTLLAQHPDFAVLSDGIPAGSGLSCCWFLKTLPHPDFRPDGALRFAGPIRRCSRSAG
jgi:hypothetical protein